MGKFSVGKKYTRNDIYEILEIPESKRGGDWNTGYHKYKDEWFIFAGVGTSGRTGHNYNNYWSGNLLFWRGRSGSKIGHKSIQDLISNRATVHIFTRNEERSPFIYQGKATAVKKKDTVPVTIVWEFNEPEDNLGDKIPGEISSDTNLFEGAKQKILVNAYERNREARQKCIDYYGCKCSVCGIDFGKRYGKHAEGFIHVHHLIPLANIGEEYKINPIEDLRPVCPNCHAVIHMRRPPYSIDEVKAMLVKSE